MAIIEEARSLGARVAATTHYAELKVFALQTPNVENACCEFDVQTLRPTYRLLIGVPGRSNAFAISKRLGIDERIVQRANALIDHESRNFEQVVSQLEDARQQLENSQQELLEEREQIEKDKQNAQALLNKARQQLEEQTERTRQESQKIIAQVKFESEQLLNELNELKKQKDKEDFTKLTQEARRRLRAGLNHLGDASNPVVEREMELVQNARPLKKGDDVFIIDLNKKGSVLEDPDENGMVLVQAGIIKTRVSEKYVKLLEPQKPQQKPKRFSSQLTSTINKQVRTEIDLRGQTVEEAIMELDRFIDQCVLMHLNEISIIHGKGTGALRAGIAQHLRHHPNIRSFRLGVYGEGESGVTIAQLK